MQDNHYMHKRERFHKLISGIQNLVVYTLVFYSDKLAAKHNCLLLLSGSLVSQTTYVKTANNADK